MSHPNLGSPALAEGSRLDRRLATILLALSLMINLVPVWWGVPAYGTWAVDEIEPSHVLGRRPWSEKYPPLHRWILTGVYTAVDAGNSVTGGQMDPFELYGAYTLAGRVLSALMATATVALIYLCARLLDFGRRASLVAAATTALMPTFAYYAKTSNLEAPYLFWFTLSLYFLLRALDGLRQRDCLLFAATAALAVATKDQAYALYLVSPLLIVGVIIHSKLRQSPWRLALVATVVDRRLWLSLFVGAGIFAVAHNLFFDYHGFTEHLRVITGEGTLRYRLFPATVAGHLSMAALALRHIVFMLSWPLATAAAIGLALALRAPRRNARLLSIAAIGIAYYLGFIAVIGYHYDRFLLGPAILLSFFAALALHRLLGQPWIPRTVAIGGVGVVFAFALVRTLGVGSAMLADSRYPAENWLQDRTEIGSSVGFGSRDMLPRGLRPLKWGWLITDGCSFLDSDRPEYVVVNSAESRRVEEAAVLSRLERGGFNYDLASRVEGQPLIPLPDLAGVLSNLDRINRELLVFERTARPCIDDSNLVGFLDQARDDPDADLTAALISIILDGDIRERITYGTAVRAVGLYHDRWTRGSRPTAIGLRNDGEAPAVPRLRLRCPPAESAPNVGIQIDDGGRRSDAACTGRGRLDLRLATLAPTEERLVMLWADKAWRPGGGDDRSLGLNVLEVDLEPVSASREGS